MSPESEITTIPKLRRVFSDTYANLPTTGVSEEDLGYATDRKIFYRWSGAAWVAITIYSGSGTIANIPLAANCPAGSLYYATDENKTYQVQSGAWVNIQSKVHTHQSAGEGGQLDHGAALTGLTDDDHTQYPKHSSGSYTGDSSVNRAIPHGLGRAPKLVFIHCTSNPNAFSLINGDPEIILLSSGTSLAVTVMNSTNFYVGNATNYTSSANMTAYTYKFIAIG